MARRADSGRAARSRLVWLTPYGGVVSVTDPRSTTERARRAKRPWLRDGGVSVHCDKCGADITYPEGTWPLGRCEPCDLRAELAAVREERDEWERTARAESDGLMMWREKTYRVRQKHADV